MEASVADRPAAAAPGGRVAPVPAWRRLRLVPAALPVALLAVLAWTHRWVADDAFINFRIVDHLLHGDGPVFNAGERVEAATSTLWVWLISLFDAVLPFRLEWIAVILGLLLALGGLAAGSWASTLLARSRGRAGLPLPLGALVFAVLPPAWDFSTSGLETGLLFGWLGGSFLLLTLVYLDRRGRSLPARGDRFGPRRLTLVAVALGLGPLVRPDFLIFSVAFVAVLVAIAGRPVARRGARLIAAAVALPLLYQAFRMGYYASLVPNTAMAKEAGASYWAQGLRYLGDFVGPYLLPLPLVALAVLFARDVRDDRWTGRRWALLVSTAPIVAGLVELLFVVKVGGDFMHARMLLPVLFALLLPVMVVPVERHRLQLALALAVAAWAVVCGLALRTSYAGSTTIGKHQYIVDERSYYIGQANGPKHPVTLADYRHARWEEMGVAVRERAARGERTVTFAGPNPPASTLRDVPARPGLPVHMVVAAANVGLFGYAAGRDVWVVDRLGLGDPLAGRMGVPVRGRPGHEKLLQPEWVWARFAAGSALASDTAAQAARHALSCAPWWRNGAATYHATQLPETLHAISAPLTVGRFLSNFHLALTSTKLRLNPVPQLAAADLCGPY